MSRNIVIIGGGIIGCTTAYYLTESLNQSRNRNLPTIPAPTSTSNDDSAANQITHDSDIARVTLIEASEHGPAQGASGKAGGLVARWAYPKELTDLSFNEHVRLAQAHNGADRWGWRYVQCGSWEGRGEDTTSSQLDSELKPGEPMGGGNSGGKSLKKTLGLPGGTSTKFSSRSHKQKKANNLPEDLLWVREDLTNDYYPIAKAGDTAQVHPYQFTTSMFELARSNGLLYINAKALSIVQNDGRVSGVEISQPGGEKVMIPATDVILAAGPWSPTIVPQLPITATRTHSITIRPKLGTPIAPYVLFAEITDPVFAGTTSNPEIYARPDGEVYACGHGDHCPLPSSVDEVRVDLLCCDLIHGHVSSISQELREGTVEKRQACYLPSVRSGEGPIIGEATSIARGLFIGTGHTCWGISNAPGTAKALAELVLEGKIKSADLRKLHPSVIL